MIQQHEIKNAFYKGLEEFLLNYKDNIVLIDVLNDYADKLNNFISNCVYKPRNDEDSPVTVNYTCSDNNDDIIIQAHKGRESVTLATIKSDNTGAFKEFRHIGCTDGITVNNVEDIKKALLRMLEEPALISALYRLICQSSRPKFNVFDSKKYEAILTRGIKDLESVKLIVRTDVEIFEILNQFCAKLRKRYSSNNFQFIVKLDQVVEFGISIAVIKLNEIPNEETLMQLKTQYGTYPVTLRDDTFGHKTANNQDELIKMLDDKMSSITLLS